MPQLSHAVTLAAPCIAITLSSLPFTASAAGLTGYVEITNNMPGLVASGLSWHGWWSVVPAGERVEDSPRCRSFSFD